MLEWIIGSGIVCCVSGKLFSSMFNARADELGYVYVGEKKKTKMSEKFKNLALYFVPVLGSLIALKFFASIFYLTFGDKKVIEIVFKEDHNYLKASQAKEVLERQIKSYSLNTISDAMRLDGASEEVIDKEFKKIKGEGILPTAKQMKKVRAMSDAEEWLISVEFDTSLSAKEKEDLYHLYVKEFSKNASNGKAIQKTLKMVNNKKN